MILIDDRVGSKELYKLFPKGRACLTRLEFGDLCFFGKGDSDDEVLTIGIERKRITDLVNSMCTGRLSGHQLPGMRATYKVIYLVVEGMYRPSPKDGLLECPRRKGKRMVWEPLKLGHRTFTYKEISKYLNSMAVLGGFYVIKTQSARETVIETLSLCSWWEEKRLSEHRSHLQVYTPHVALSIRAPSLMRRLIQEIPGIGIEKALAAEKHFKTPLQMVLSTEGDWKKVPGIGDKLAQKIVSLLQEGETK